MENGLCADHQDDEEYLTPRDDAPPPPEPEPEPEPESEPPDETPPSTNGDDYLKLLDESIMALYEQGFNDAEISRTMGERGNPISTSYIGSWRDKRNLTSNYFNTKSQYPTDIQRLVVMARESGAEWAEITKTLANRGYTIPMTTMRGWASSRRKDKVMGREAETTATEEKVKSNGKMEYIVIFSGGDSMPVMAERAEHSDGEKSLKLFKGDMLVGWFPKVKGYTCRVV